MIQSLLRSLGQAAGAVVLAAGLTLGSPALAAAPAKVQTESIVPPLAPQASPQTSPLAPPATDPHARPPASGPSAASALTVRYGTDGLPERVRVMRERILEAVRSGDIERLRSVITSNELPPIFAVNEVGDPIEYLKSQSGDPEGREILAILWDILEAGWVIIHPGKAQEMVVWPYFAEYPIDQLTPEQLVEMYRIVTASDYDEMRSVGRYIFYEVGIGPDGTWHYFKLAD